MAIWVITVAPNDMCVLAIFGEEAYEAADGGFMIPIKSWTSRLARNAPVLASRRRLEFFHT